MGVLILFATIIFSAGLIAAASFLIVVRRFKLMKYIIAAGLLWYSIYGIALLGVSFSSHEKTLSIGDSKRFCGFYLDCHVMARVKGVKQSQAFGLRKPSGRFYVVEIEMLSDAKSANLGVRSPAFWVTDENGNRYIPINELSTPSENMERRIIDGQSIPGILVFDIPNSVDRLRLDVRSEDPVDSFIESFVIGDEDSLFHKRTNFSI